MELVGERGNINGFCNWMRRDERQRVIAGDGGVGSGFNTVEFTTHE